MNDSSIIIRWLKFIRVAKSLLSGVVRTLLYLAVGASGVAILVGRAHGPVAGRSIPAAPATRIPASGMRAVVNATVFTPSSDRPWMLDPEHGRFLRLDLEEDIVLKNASVSSRQDERGRWQVAGGWRRRTTDRWGFVSVEAGLVLLTFPGGQILDRIACDPVPVGAPCWYPDGANRILFPTASGSLYYCQFSDASRGDSDRSALTTAGRLSWRSAATGNQVLCILDPMWPADPEFRSTLLVCLSHLTGKPGGPKSSPWEIWWLRLSDEGDLIEEAGRLDDPESDGALALFDARFPCLGGNRSGLVLAYLTLAPPPTGWQLRIAPVDIDPGSGVPRAHFPAGRILATQRLPVRPVFSADGRWVASAHGNADPSQPVDRFFVGDGCGRVRVTPRSANIESSVCPPRVTGVER